MRVPMVAATAGDRGHALAEQPPALPPAVQGKTP
jgi:hypothetical protein